MPPANLILQALHAIKGSVDKTNERLDVLTVEVKHTNERLDQTNERLDQTNERLDSLREFTVKGLTELNHKMDEGFDRLGKALDRQGNEIHQLNERLDNFLTGEGAKLVKRVDTLESEFRRIAAKVDH